MKNFQRLFILICLGLFLYGCGSSGMRIVTYSQDRPREDQEISGIDNTGYIGGSMKSGNITSRKKTRKMYVMEISKESGDIEPIVETTPTAQEEAAIPSNIIVTSSSSAVTAEGQSPVLLSPQAGRFVQYTVEKDDTLQKIAKKFYDSYNQWTRIYESNKAAIPNPDRLKTGTVLQIPMD